MSNDKKIKVMIVDDSFLMRSILRNILEKDSCFSVVAEAANGGDAIAALEKIDDPDIILLDIEMPVMNGIQFMKNSRLKTSAKILIVSSVAKFNSPEAREALSLGAVDIITKPSGVLSVDMEETKSKEIIDCLHRCLAISA
jgi:two-component system chemotaxis response regulator CheB